jgi:glycosyltransferase involved in cell wall biosynthesis
MLSALRFIVGARRALRAEQRGARVIAHFFVPSAWPIGTGLGHAPFEVVVHGSDARLLARLPSPLRRHIARLLAGAEVRAASEELRELVARALGPALGARTRVQAPGLDVSGVPVRAEARRRLRVPDCSRLGVVVSRLVAKKRVEVALRAASIAGVTELAVIGDGPERARLERAFRGVRFTGLLSRDQALEWIAAADVLISASREEGSPSVVREARALGTRVVAVTAGDLAELAGGDAGIWLLGP